MSPEPNHPEPSPDATSASARRGLLWFGLGVLLASAPLEVLIVRSAKPFEAQPLFLALIAVPGGVSALVRLARREGFGDISMRVGNRRALATAWFLPVAALGIAYGAAWATGLEHFEPPPRVLASMGTATAAFAASFGLALVQGTVFGSLTAAAEEIGWRGYLLPRLVDAGVRRPALASGLACALWQLPLVLSGRYAPGPSVALSTLLFVAGTIAHAYALAKLRLGSGSVWPAIIFHASWAAQLQGSFEAFTAGSASPLRSSLWVGESGLLVVAATAALVLAYVMRPWPVRRTPNERSARWMGLSDA
jgi:uncharacterized protein